MNSMVLLQNSHPLLLSRLIINRSFSFIIFEICFFAGNLGVSLVLAEVMSGAYFTRIFNYDYQSCSLLLLSIWMVPF